MQPCYSRYVHHEGVSKKKKNEAYEGGKEKLGWKNLMNGLGMNSYYGFRESI